MIDEGELRRRFPEIPWDQPVLVSVLAPNLSIDAAPHDDYISRWVCRYCIAMHGLKAQAIVQRREPEFVYLTREDALEHIETVHHE
jgi:hypothetical protein